MTDHIDSKGVQRLEKEVSEIKQTTKETNQTVNELSQQVIKIETILTEQNKFNLAQMKHLADDNAELWQTVKQHDNRITFIENNGLPARIKKVEEYFRWIVLLIMGAVLTGLLNLILQ